MERVCGNIVSIEKQKIFPGFIVIEDEKIKQIEPLDVREYNSIEDIKQLPYIMCGFIDSHIHPELSYLVPSEYARLALSKGCLGALVDCHEIVHVSGYEGIKSFIEASKDVPFYFGFSAPSTSIVNSYTMSDMEKLLSLKEVTHLGEMMNFPAVILSEERELYKIKVAKKVKKPIDGHAPGLCKWNLKKYAGFGVSTDHECHSTESAIEKIKAGLSVQININDDNWDPETWYSLINEYPNNVMFCSDISSCRRISQGYLKKAVAKAIAENCNIFNVLQVATVNPVKHYGLETGLLRKGDYADFIVVNNLSEFTVNDVYFHGNKVYSNTENVKKIIPVVPTIKTSFPEKINKEDIAVCVSTDIEKRKVCAIACFDRDSNTIRKYVDMPVINGELKSNVSEDCLKLVLMSRKEPKISTVAFLCGTGMKKGAYAMSISHDDHNIIAVGTSDEDIIAAINNVLENNGGICVCNDGEKIAELPLPVVGLMSDKTMEEVIEMYNLVCNTISSLGNKLSHPITTLSFMAHPLVPTIKLSLDGLFDVASQEIVPVILPLC